MDAVKRAYAYTAWTQADPLKDLDAEERLAILLMRPTWRERLLMRPWKTRYEKHHAMLDILAERRLAYQLTTQRLAMKLAPVPAPGHKAEPPPLSPYYKHRLALQHHAITELRTARSAEDKAELATNPDARIDRDRRAEIRNRLKALEIERARLHLQELELDEEHTP